MQTKGKIFLEQWLFRLDISSKKLRVAVLLDNNFKGLFT